MLRHTTLQPLSPLIRSARILHPSVSSPYLHANSPRHAHARHDTVARSQGKRRDTKTSTRVGPPLLRPFDLGQRLKRMCDEGKHGDAIKTLANMPRDAQNVVVWNMLILECMKVKRFQAAYDMYIDMKRRGFVPNFSTYSVMLQGLSRIDQWDKHTKQLENAHALFASFRRFAEETEAKAPHLLQEMHNGPVNAYIKILGDSHLYQQMFDVYHDLTESGPVSANAFTYTVIFQVLAERKETPSTGGLSVPQRNAADVRFLWHRMEKLSNKGDFSLDAFVIGAAVRVLSEGRQVDQDLAFDIIRVYLGLEDSGSVASSSSSSPPKIAITTQLFQVILEFCNRSRHYERCARWLQQALHRKIVLEGGVTPDRAHCQQALIACAAQAAQGSTTKGGSFDSLGLLEQMLRESTLDFSGAKSLSPTLSTYEVVMAACWLRRDWSATKRVFFLMTGYNMDDFADDCTRSPTQEERPTRRNTLPNPVVMSYIARTAVKTHDPANIRQCLRAMIYLGGERFLKTHQSSDKVARYAPHYRLKLASAVLRMVDATKKDGSPGLEARQLASLAREAKHVEQTLQGAHPIPLIEGEAKRFSKAPRQGAQRKQSNNIS